MPFADSLLKQITGAAVCSHIDCFYILTGGRNSVLNLLLLMCGVNNNIERGRFSWKVINLLRNGALT
jgi:hypothetical protein